MDCNIFLLGRTGVGKSSLINYLAQQPLAETGIPDKIGGLTRGIHKYKMIINGQNCVVADSEGLEFSHSDFWLNLIDKELFKEGKNGKISDWYHIVIYCIGINEGRAQDSELSIIKKLVDAGYGVIVALTKSDTATDEELNDVRDAIESYTDWKTPLYYVPICSVKTRFANPEGKDLLGEAVVAAWGDSIANRLPDYIYDEILGPQGSLQVWNNLMYDWMERQRIHTYNKRFILYKLNKKIQKEQTLVNEQLKNRFEEASREILGVYGLISNILNLTQTEFLAPNVLSKMEKLKSSLVFQSKAKGNAATIALGIGAVFNLGLLVGLPVAILLIHLKGRYNKKKRVDELEDAFDLAYLKLVAEYETQKNLLQEALQNQNYKNKLSELN